ncbi:hypothetical protein BDV93DRAFT_596720 [Ceratobasidium sp. AG-I]|nr:hypothetical protein BDV93DRAFT_596720 [Ceratobasidium sp. AG-I]
MIFAAGLVFAAAGALSAPCAAAITGVSVDPTFTCLGVSDLWSVVFAFANQSFIASVDSWVTSTCAQPACPNVTVDSLFTQITTGCATDLSNIGVTPIVIKDIRASDKDLYRLGRELLCLKDSTSNTSCISTALRAIESHSQVLLSISSLWSAVSTLAVSGGQVLKNLTCTSCAQGAYPLIRPFLGFFELIAADISLGLLCGANFFNGTRPAGVVQSANTASPVPGVTANSTTSITTSTIRAPQRTVR